MPKRLPPKYRETYKEAFKIKKRICTCLIRIGSPCLWCGEEK